MMKALPYNDASGPRHVFIVTELACGGDLLALLLAEEEVGVRTEYLAIVVSRGVGIQAMGGWDATAQP